MAETYRPEALTEDTLSQRTSPQPSCARPLSAALFFVLNAEAPARYRPLAAYLRNRSSIVVGRTMSDSSERARVSSRGNSMRIDLLDRFASRSHACLDCRVGTWRVVDQGSRNGVFVNGERVSEGSLSDGDVLSIGDSFFVFRTHVPEPEPADDHPLLQTQSPELAAQYERVRWIASSDVPVMVTGPSGAGKERVARALHELSARSGPCVPVDCAALAKSLIETELFGHQGGAFTGSGAARPGLVRQADGGTLFLDEVAELTPRCQATLLRVLQESRVRPVGSDTSFPVNFRLVSATHKNLAQAIAAGRFREDFYGRVVGLTVRLPRLAERREDTGIVLRTILKRADLVNRSLSRSDAFWLFSYAWPRNIRELEHTVIAAAALSKSHGLPLRDTVGSFDASERDAAAASQVAATPKRRLLTQERLRTKLDEQNGNVTNVARELGLSRMHVYRLCRKFSIEPRRHRIS